MADGKIKSTWQRDFKVLARNQALMIRLGLSSDRLTDDSFNDFFKSFVPYFNFTFLSINLIFCAMVIIQSFPDLDLVLEPLIVFIGGMQGGGMFLSVGLNIKNVKTLYLAVQKIVHDERTIRHFLKTLSIIDKTLENRSYLFLFCFYFHYNIKGEHEDIIRIYWRIEQKCRKYTNFFTYYIFVNQSMYMTAVILSISSMLNDDYDTSKWLLAWSVPFDTNHLTVLQWYLLWFAQFSFGLAYSSSALTVTSYFVCGCFYIGGLCDHFEYLINSTAKDLHVKSSEWSSERIERIKLKLCKAIDVHENIYEIFNIMTDINNGAILVLLLPNVIFMASIMYTAEHTTMDWVMLAFNVICAACSLCWPYVYCHFATMTTERIASISDVTYSANWYDYPPILKKYLILMIARSQEEIFFSGFGFVYCTLEILLKLLNASVSYYLIFRTLSQIQ